MSFKNLDHLDKAPSTTSQMAPLHFQATEEQLLEAQLFCSQRGGDNFAGYIPTFFSTGV